MSNILKGLIITEDTIDPKYDYKFWDEMTPDEKMKSANFGKGITVYNDATKKYSTKFPVEKKQITPINVNDDDFYEIDLDNKVIVMQRGPRSFNLPFGERFLKLDNGNIVMRGMTMKMKGLDKILTYKANEDIDLEEQQLDEDLRKWFKEKWVRFGPDGKIRGACARGDDSEGKPKCLPQSKAHSLGKKGRASAAARKRREDPNPERSGKAINVATKKKSNEGVAKGLDAEAYKEKLLATLPQIMRFYAKNVKGWRPSQEQMLAAVETGYTVMKHTGDVKQAGKAVMDELNTIHSMSQGQGVAEGRDNPLQDIDPRGWHLIRGDRPIAINFPDEYTAKSFHSGHGYGRETKILHGSQVRQNAYLQHNPGVINYPEYSKDVAGEFGPLPQGNQTIQLGKYTVNIERVGLNKNYIGFTWNDSQGREHYEEVPVGDLGDYDALEARIKGEISGVERRLKKGVAEGAMKDLDIDLQDQQWDAIVGYVIDGLKNNMDIGRMELNLYQYAGQEMFDVDQELENRGFRDLEDLADHIKQHNGRYVPPRDFDLGKGVTEGSEEKDNLISTLNSFGYYTDDSRVYVNNDGDKIVRFGSEWKHQSGKRGRGPEELSNFLSGNQGVAEGSLNEFSIGGGGDDNDDVRGPGLTRQEFKNALKLALGYDMAGVDVSTFEGNMLRIEVNGERRIVPCNKLGVKDATAFVKRIKKQGVAEAELDEACWKGYHKEGMKTMFGKKYPNCVKNTNEEQLDEKCWDTHKQVGMKNKGSKMVPNCVPKESVAEEEKKQKSAKALIYQTEVYGAKGYYGQCKEPGCDHKTKTYDRAVQAQNAIKKHHQKHFNDIEEGHQQCPECGGAMYEAEMMNEKKDACYYKVKSRYKVWPSAYASGALVKCRKKGAKNWGNKSESVVEGSDDDIWGPQGNFAGNTKVDISNVAKFPKWQIGLPVFVKHISQKGTIASLEGSDVIVNVGLRQYRVPLSGLKRYPMQDIVKDQIDEKWSKKYKDSINCNNPKGFSQRAHCQGRKKNESVNETHIDNSLQDEIYHRLENEKPDLFTRYGLEYVSDTVEAVANKNKNSNDIDLVYREVINTLKKQNMSEHKSAIMSGLQLYESK